MHFKKVFFSPKTGEDCPEMTLMAKLFHRRDTATLKQDHQSQNIMRNTFVIMKRSCQRVLACDVLLCRLDVKVRSCR